MKKVISVCLILLSFYGSAQQTSKFIDERDGKAYQTVVIGNQTWMAENLNVDRFRNGDIIPEAKTNEEWQKAGENKQPAWCYYDNDTINGAKYGKLYNWYAISDERILAPRGWRVPSFVDWTTLNNQLEVDSGRKMKSSNGWKNWSDDINIHLGNGTNSSGFSAIPSGIRLNNGMFNELGVGAYWWDSLEFSHYLYGYVETLNIYENRKEDGLSIRCIKD
jgi:uncharacterized protein (TIGR02145 family)